MNAVLRAMAESTPATILKVPERMRKSTTTRKMMNMRPVHQHIILSHTTMTTKVRISEARMKMRKSTTMRR